MNTPAVEWMHQLIRANEASALLYESAATNGHLSDQLTAYFQQQAQRHRTYREASRQALRQYQLGEESAAVATGSSLAIDAGDDECAILKKCAASITGLLPIYQEAVHQETLPIELRNALDKEFQMCQQALGSLKEKMAAIKQSTEAKSFEN